MAYENLKSAIKQAIKQNGNQEITGNLLQSTLLNIVNTVGEGATFAGIAIPTTNPGTPEGNTFYLAGEPGNYTNFGNIIINKGLYSISFSNNSWHADVIIEDFNIVPLEVYDTSVFSATGKYTKQPDGSFGTDAAIDSTNNL